jgi:AcrR family transcriptional regulator
MDMPKPTVLRRTPSQDRSRERVETLLNCAIDLIREKGSDALKMSEVAKLAGVSIGSLYQYFPDKSAIIRTLSERTNDECRGCIVEGLAGPTTMDALCTAFEALIDEYFTVFRDDPVIRDIRNATLADKSLQEVEIAECRVIGGILADAVLRVRPEAEEADVGIRSFTIMSLAEAAMRLAVSVPPEDGARLVESYKSMAVAELRKM